MAVRRVRRTIRHSGEGIDLLADVNAVIATGGGSASARDRTRGVQMAENQTREELDAELTEEELDQESGEELPDREAMSLINANLAAPVNAAVALNVLSDGSTAYANAEQDATIIQST
jgi:hypothetical protein